MPILNVNSYNSFSNIKALAIAIAGSEITHSDARRHLGIFFRNDKDELSLMHLGWHLRLENNPPNPSYCWIPCEGLNSVLLENIADWLDVIWQMNGSKLPYSIRQYDSDPFDGSGKLIKSEPGDGFTCATFVLWVFYRAQVDLIEKSSWQNRAGDQDWAQWAISMLRQHNSNETSHIAKQAEHISSAIRFRPEEVAGAAAIYIDTPIAYEKANELANCILGKMKIFNKI